MVAEAKQKGYGVKVALIAAAPDLGAYPYLLSDPQKYADLLTREITFNTKPRVLTVLPSGLGGKNLGDNAGDALSGIQPDAEGGGDALARTAMVALGRLRRPRASRWPSRRRRRRRRARAARARAAARHRC